MATLAQGQAARLNLKASQSITVTPSSTGRATVSANGPGNLVYTQKTIYAAETFGPYVADTVMSIAAVSGSLEYTDPYTLVPSYSLDASNNVTGLVGPGGTTLPSWIASANCHFHGFAGQQIVGDPKFYDLAGSNHGVFGDNLSNANAWATGGYVSTIDPTGGATDSVIRIPSLNFDYAGGEKLIVWWLGYATPEGADVAMLGDGYGTTAGQRGVRLRMKTDGKFDLSLYGATQGFSGSSDTAVFDGTLHSAGFAFDGTAKTHGLWTDDVYHSSMGSVLQTFSSATVFDTTNSNTFNIGSPFAAAAASTTGAAVSTRALCVYRLPAATTMLSVAEITALFQQLRANPSKLALNTAV